MNSIPWIGKFLGCIVVESMIDHLGYPVSISIAAVVQAIGLTIEMTAHLGSFGWQRFTIGRNFAYLAVGMVSLSIPSQVGSLRTDAWALALVVGRKHHAKLLRRNRSECPSRPYRWLSHVCCGPREPVGCRHVSRLRWRDQ
jgi:hypothetical protein